MLQAENSVVLLCRDHPSGAPGIRDLDLDVTLWQPLIEDRGFVPWLVNHPGEQVCLASCTTSDCQHPSALGGLFIKPAHVR